MIDPLTIRSSHSLRPLLVAFAGHQNPIFLANTSVTAVDLLLGCSQGRDDDVRHDDAGLPEAVAENAQLVELLSHYAQLGAEDRAVWQDRLMQMEGVDAKQLTALHGELIAFDWVEQNTGHALGRPDGTISNCYRVTQNGLWEFRRIHGSKKRTRTSGGALDEVGEG